MTMITLEMAIAKIKKLPAEQRNEVIKFVEYLEFKLDNIEQSQEQYCRVRQPPAFPLPHKRSTRGTLQTSQRNSRMRSPLNTRFL